MRGLLAFLLAGVSAALLIPRRRSNDTGVAPPRWLNDPATRGREVFELLPTGEILAHTVH